MRKLHYDNDPEKSSGDASGDGEPNEVEMVWGEWSGCSLSCGGGTKVRLLVDRPERNQTSVCNTNECPFDPLEKPGCSCLEGELACQESFTTSKCRRSKTHFKLLYKARKGQCKDTETCQSVSTANEMRCLEKKFGKCGAYGDPHVYTFDGAQNDVYGVANYTFTQLNSSLVDLRAGRGF